MITKLQLAPGAIAPHRAHATDVGYDIHALHTCLVTGDGTSFPLATKEDCLTMKNLRIDIAKIKVDTGVHLTPPKGHYFELVPNSRLSKIPFMYANSIGVIDPEYTGSIRVILKPVNYITPEDLEAFLPGNVVGQLILRKQLSTSFTPVSSLTPTERGDGGFGSTATR